MMRNKLLAALATIAVAFVLGVPSAHADQITLGNDTCVGGVTISSGPTVTGAGFSCTDDASFQTTGHPNIGSVPSSWSYDPTTEVLSVDINGNQLSGTVNWTTDSGMISNGLGGYIDVLAGSISVTSLSTDAFYNEYIVGNSYAIDITFQNCSLDQNENVACAHPSSGEIPTPEPGTLTLLGTGLLSMAGFVRRKFRA
jgi:PEP-CTERM motif